MSIPIIINETNITNAWCKIMQYIVDHAGIEISPLVLTISQFEETNEVKDMLNSDLLTTGLDSIDTVSETIFPNSLYQYYNDRHKLYSVYRNNLPRIKKIDTRNNKGTYFERLIAFGDADKINQLEIIITSLQQESKVKRRSKLQASTFDPLKDHTNGAFQGFPCLQHVTFYKSETGGLVLNSFYAIQYLYQRAYGNWLGLINLGKFVAKETNLEFERFNCFIGVEKLDRLNKFEATSLLNKLKTRIDPE